MSNYDFSFSNFSFGNDNLNYMLNNVLLTKRLSHAYLFYGANNLFKTHIALNFAMKIFCTQTAENTNFPCGECSSCSKFLNGSHPDLYLYNLDGEARTGRDSIHIETTRFIRQDAYIRPNESDYKIYVIPNIQDMSIGAVNAFLKILEEPPSHTIFLLTAVSKTAILDTILSRCIPFEVFPITVEEEVKAIKLIQPKLNIEDITVACSSSNGYLGKALNLLEDKISIIDEKIANNENKIVKKDDKKIANTKNICEEGRNATIALVNNNEYQLLLAITKFKSSRVVMLDFLTEFSINVKNCLKYKINNESNSSNENNTDRLIVDMAQKYSIEKFYNILQILEDVRSSIGHNINMDIFCMNLSSKISQALSAL